VTDPSSSASADRLVELYTSRYEYLVRLAFVLVDNNEQAEEIVQEAFARALVRGDRVGEPEAYVQRSVVNACYDVLRRRRLERVILARLRRDEAVAEPDYIGDLLATLPPRERVALTLRHYGDLSVDQIAAAMGCPPGTVKTLLHRGAARLRGQVRR